MARMAPKTRQNIQDGMYVNKLRLPTLRDQQKAGPGGLTKIVQERAAHRQEDKRLNRQFMLDALEELGLRDHPKGEQAFKKAWDDVHAMGGFFDVLDALEELADLMLP